MKLVNKEDAVEAIENTDWYHINKDGELVSGANSQDHIPLYKADDVYKAIDSVEPIDAIPIEFIKKRIDILHNLSEYEFEVNGGYCGQASTSEYELRNLLKDWEKEQGGTEWN